MSLAPEELLNLVTLLEDANSVCDQILREHNRREPSNIWLLISVLSGIGGIALMGPLSVVPFVITLGGAAGGLKSVYDLNAHMNEAQYYLSLTWSIRMRTHALRYILARRGIG